MVPAVFFSIGLPPPPLPSSSVSMGLGGLFRGCWRCNKGGGGGGGGGCVGMGMSALSLDMEREGPAAEPSDPGWGDSSPSAGPSSILVDS